MAPSHADSTSSDEEDAPESVSLIQSKLHVKQRDDVLKRVHAAEKKKKRMRNQERDRRLKEQAEGSKRRRREDAGDVNLEARMERAMQEAEAEMGDDGDDDEGADFGEEEDGDFMGIDAVSAESSEGDNPGEEDEDSEEGDEEMDTDEEEPPAKLKSNPNHLPDHLFTAAFSSKSAKPPLKREATDGVPTRKARKRVRSNAPLKDLLIGSRAIRTLATGRPLAGASTLPSAKIKKFLDRRLALKGGTVKTRGWERRPVNIGVMRRDGPAAGFVRNR